MAIRDAGSHACLPARWLGMSDLKLLFLAFDCSKSLRLGVDLSSNYLHHRCHRPDGNHSSIELVATPGPFRRKGTPDMFGGDHPKKAPPIFSSLTHSVSPRDWRGGFPVNAMVGSSCPRIRKVAGD